jgi:peroxiredoxin
MKTLLAILFIGFFSGLMTTEASADPTVAQVGAAAPQFTLSDMSGKQVSLADFKGKIVVLEWTNPACPYVVGHYENGHMPGLQSKYAKDGIVWLTVNSTNPSNSGAKSNEEYTTIYADWKSGATSHLRDASGEIGKSYGAKTTPHMFIVDQTGKLVYSGAIDDDRSTNGGSAAKVNYVVQAIDELKAGKSVSISETKPYGCSVKY